MIRRSLLALFGFLAAAAAANAQFPQAPGTPPVARPTYSPYLNLLRSGPTYQNYFGLVQPQIQAQNAIQNLQQQVQTLGLQNSPQSVYGGTGGELITGKSVGFFTHRSWFMNAGGVGKANYLAGQQSTSGNNAVFNSQQQSPQAQRPPVASSPIVPNSNMPFRR